MRQRVNIYEAKNQFSTLIEKARAGAEIVIARNGRPVCRLVSLLLHEQDGQCSARCLTETCRTLAIAAPEVLALALERVRLDLAIIGLTVDLNALLRDERETLTPLQHWATRRLASQPDGIVRLHLTAVDELAIAFDYKPGELVAHLAEFSPNGNPADPERDGTCAERTPPIQADAATAHGR